jgi:hypothetical protein
MLPSTPQRLPHYCFLTAKLRLPRPMPVLRAPIELSSPIRRSRNVADTSTPGIVFAGEAFHQRRSDAFDDIVDRCCYAVSCVLPRRY